MTVGQRRVVETEDIGEATFNELKRSTSSVRKARSKNCKKQSMKRKVDEDGNVRYDFAFESGENHTGPHRGHVTINKDKSIEVSCDCEDYQYVWEVANTELGASSIIFSNGDEPIVKNPEKIPGMCKHLMAMDRFLKRGEKS